METFYLTENGVKYWRPDLSNISLKAEIGADSITHSHVGMGDGVIIGQRCRIQAFSFLPTGVILGDDVFIGPRVTFTNEKYPPLGGWSNTIVECGAVIGAGAIILPGLVIGKGALIGAGAVVTRDIPAGETWIGNPAKLAER